jgi:predicted Zn-dependent protease
MTEMSVRFLENSAIKALRRGCVACLSAVLLACGGTGGLTIEDEQQIGAQTAYQIEDQIGVYPGEYLATYVDSVGRRLVSELSDTPYYFRFKIVDQAEPNAFAIPGGHIYVSRGLMAVINTEDELAGILAHEISHVTMRHHARQAQRGMLPAVLALPGAAVGKVVGEDVGNFINAPIDAAGKAYVASYGRAQESEADRAGMQLAGRAGYDPAALATALDNLERTVGVLTGKTQGFSFFDSHPQTPTRIADIHREATAITWQPAKPFAKDRAALLKRLEGLTWGPNNPMQGVFAGQQFMQPDMNFSITFPDGWGTVNTPGYVGAFEPNQQAFVLFGGAERPGPAHQLGEAFAAKLRSEAKIEPAEIREFKIGEWPAFLVRVEDTTGAVPVSIYYAWVNSQRMTFQIVGVGADDYREQLRDTALSLRDMTDEERAAVVVYRIHTVSAEAGETLEQLAIRTNNAFSVELTAAINGLAADSELDAKSLIKILRKEPYLSRP